MKRTTSSAAAWTFSMMLMLASPTAIQAAASTTSVVQMADVQKRVDSPDKRLVTRGQADPEQSSQSNMFHEKHVEEKSHNDAEK